MVLQNKIDFAVVVSVSNANPNGDPNNEGMPRVDYDGYGEISSECVKRKIRNRMQDLGHDIFVQSDERIDDGFATLKLRAKELEKLSAEELHTTACKKWLDTRTFGQLFAFSGFTSSSVGVRGPVSIQLATSVDPIEIATFNITKSTSSDKAEKAIRGKDQMGKRSFVRFGLYTIKGSINVQLAEKTGFSDEDAQVLKDCLATLFENDASASRPDGSMEVVKLYWWEHNSKAGQYSSAKVHRALKITRKDENSDPKSFMDYDIRVDELPGLKCEIIDNT